MSVTNTELLKKVNALSYQVTELQKRLDQFKFLSSGTFSDGRYATIEQAVTALMKKAKLSLVYVPGTPAAVVGVDLP